MKKYLIHSLFSLSLTAAIQGQALEIHEVPQEHAKVMTEGQKINEIVINGEKFDVKVDADDQPFAVTYDDVTKREKAKINRQGVFFFTDSANSGLARQGWFNIGIALANIIDSSLGRSKGLPAGGGGGAAFDVAFRPLQYKHLAIGFTGSRIVDPSTEGLDSKDPENLKWSGQYYSSGRQIYIEHDVWAAGDDILESDIDGALALSAGFYVGSYASKQLSSRIATKETTNGAEKYVVHEISNVAGRTNDKGIFLKARMIINGGNLYLKYDHGLGQAKLKKISGGFTLSFGGPGR